MTRERAATLATSALAGAFERIHGAPPRAFVRAPGRVNLIGEHTDYNDGFVLPLAIDREVRLALTPRADRLVRLHTLDLGLTAEFDLGALARDRGWAEYPKGVAWALQEHGGLEVRGFDAVLASDVPRGAGLSSSAALELATALAFQVASGFEWDARRMAVVCQKAENEWVGVASGIMDQLVSAAGVAGHALLIDCRTLELAPAPLPAGTAVVVLDTGTRRGLADSAYNERRAECDAAARHFGVTALRDLSAERLEAGAAGLDERSYRRARHVVTENARTLAAARALHQADAAAVGRLMNESHASLRDDFEVSSPALDAMADCARSLPGCYGARMTGAGFGGCAVALIDAAAAPEFIAAVESCYRRATNETPSAYLCRAAPGAGRLPA